MTLKPIMLVRPPLGILYDRGFWDELAQAGIDEVAIQWLALLDDRGGEQTRYPQVEDTHPRALAAVGGAPVQRTPVASYVPNHSLYEGLSIAPPEMPPRLAEEATRLKTAIRSAIDRGFKIYVMDDKGYFLTGGFGSGKPRPARRCVNDPDLAGYAVTRTRDLMANYPGLSGILLDGPDFRWEIKPGHRDDMFVEECGCRHCERLTRSLGFPYRRVIEGREALKKRLQNLSPSQARDFVENRGGVVGAYAWWAEQPETLDWMRFRHAAVEQHLKAVYGGIKEYHPALQVGSSSRMPAVAPLTGHSVRRKRAYTDFQMPKLYWWSGGVAGFRGTVTNWVDTLVEWNPGLSEDDATRWVSAAFDLSMPSDYPVRDYAKEATDEWFRTTVDGQVRKMLADVGDADRFVPWVGLEHFGSQWVTPGELRRLLGVMQARGTRRYCYFVYNSITPDIWRVITEFSAGRSEE